MATKKTEEKTEDDEIDIFEPNTWVLNWEVIDGVEQKPKRTRKTTTSKTED